MLAENANSREGSSERKYYLKINFKKYLKLNLRA